MSVEGFGEVGGAKTLADRLWEGENGQSLGNIFFHPGGEFWGDFSVFEDGGGEQIACGLEVWSVENGTDVSGDGFFQILLGDVGLGVFLEMELAAIPRNGREDGGESGFDAFVGIAGDGAGDGEAALFEAGKEVAPVNFGFGEGDGGAENGAFAVGGVDGDGGEDGTGTDDAGGADFFVTGINDDVSHGRNGAIAPSFEHGVEFFGGFADLSGSDILAPSAV